MPGLRFFALGTMLLLTLTFTLAADEAAKKKRKGDLAAQFKKLDTDNDNKVSLKEFEKFGKADKAKRATKLFGKLDSNSDNFLSVDEFKKVTELRKKKSSS